ncbi:hypothetical protein CSC70_03000 [Pseudoxanthomonas kalamensis DSM 18571]|uniref:M23 family metallopeptidase n=1 Tax=Pseudoxanthomonas kalamensis TaxID=289483 RepID=UPI001390CBEC|nr:peptidoglycan DD-metalloendopeptidase family protein [Pseudoxanthomonas kalamensis]KAF1712500.1 hypothetical protein CSC70_03000 [Pseudoxanthomonas kalamensis DSM 18571]
MQHHGDGDGRKQRFRDRLEIHHDTSLHQQLRQHLNARRWGRRQWIHACLFTTIGLLVATIVPGFSSALQTPVSEPLATLPLSLPALSERTRAGGEEDGWQLVRVKPGHTLSAMFEELGIPAATLYRLLDNKDAKAKLSRLRPGNEIAFDLDDDGKLRALRYDRDPLSRVELRLDGDQVKQTVIERESVTRTVVLSGKVGRSFTRSARKAGLTAANINALTDDIFKYDVDFNSDLDADDRFSVVVEQTWREGELVGTGPVQAATFTVDDKLYSGFRFARQGGKPEYFTAQGRPLKKSFIRMPIPYARLSSRFGSRRHPVLGKMRMHKGVDYAAARGTPIMAAGDARVKFVGQQRGYGNVVILDHGKGYTTLYAHMSKFGKVRTGQRIPQGTVIGYVGSTGLATGPHLHYEFRVNGAHRNPLSITMPPPEPLAGKELAAFRSYTSSALARIRTVEDVIYAEVPPAKEDAGGKTVASSTVKPAAAKKG